MKRMRKKFPHGTRRGYSDYHCRCPKCTTAIREYMRKYKVSVGPGADGTPEWDQMDLDLLLSQVTT